mgnify:CR=1 FL=1
MKEFGVIFSGPMVPRVLDGSKTQTRRAVKIKDSPGTKPWYPVGNHFTPTQLEKYRVYPRWHVGDQIWMKETWMPETEQGIPTGGIIYRATNRPETDGTVKIKWRSPLFMPKWASRFTGNVLRTWIERLQDISEEDARAEGAELHPWTNAHTYRESFSMLWNSLNGKTPGLSWADTWVLATEFRRVE